MRDRMYRGDTIRGQSLSPRRPAAIFRDHYSSKHRDYSPRSRREIEKYPRAAARSPRYVRSAHFDRDSDSRVAKFPNYDERGRDRPRPTTRHSRSPRRIERRDHYDRDEKRDHYNSDASMRRRRFSDYDGGHKDRAREEFSNYDTSRGAGKREYSPQSHNPNGLGVRRSRSPHRSERRDHFDSDSNVRSVRLSNYDVDSTLAKTQWEHPLDEPKKSVKANDDRYASDYYVVGDSNAPRGGVGDSNAPRGGAGKDYYQQSPYSNGLFSSSSSKQVSLDYERGGKMQTDSYTLSGCKFGGKNPSNTVASGSGYLNSENDKLGSLELRDKVRLGRRGGAYSDDKQHYFEKKDDDFHFKDDLNLDELGTAKSVEREIYKYDKKDRILSSHNNVKGESDYFHSLSKSKGYVSSGHLRDSVPAYSSMGAIDMPPHRAPLGREVIGTVGIFEKVRSSLSPRRPGPSDDLGTHSGSYLSLSGEKHGDDFYTEFDRSAVHKYAGEEYGDHKMSRIGILDPIIDKPSPRENIGAGALWDPYSSAGVRSRKRDLDLNGGSEAYLGYELRKHDERHTEVGGSSWSFSERLGVQSGDYDEFSQGRSYDSPRTGLSLIESAERSLTYQHARDEPVFSRGVSIRISSDGNGARTIYRQEDGRDEMDLVSLSKKPKFGKLNYEKTRMELSERDSYHQSSEKFIPAQLSNRHESNSRDIKRRLGPVPQKLHVSQRLVDKHKPSIKKRLGPAPKKHTTLPWIKNLTSSRISNVPDGSDGSPHDLVRVDLADADHFPKHETSVKSEEFKQILKPEPAVKSEEFKQLVQIAFFNFLKQLNETLAQRKKYLAQARVGNLKCIVCGSNSDEFDDAESLTVHTFTSEKAGLRSQHLGLHKALCVLNGWKIGELSSSVWSHEEISINELKALKEDLIIWPPVVILHNSTIVNKNPEEQIVVPAEKLGIKIKGMGIGNVDKVCMGKPADQNVMVVKFNGTLSGLQQAEKLHTDYIDKQHGRAEFEQVNSSESCSEGDKEDGIFYGYLGVAEDLDKLDFDNKKRCVLRSKKEILSIV